MTAKPTDPHPEWKQMIEESEKMASNKHPPRVFVRIVPGLAKTIAIVQTSLDKVTHDWTSYIPETESLERERAARAEAISEAVDILKERMAQGILLRATLDELDEMSDAARGES